MSITTTPTTPTLLVREPSAFTARLMGLRALLPVPRTPLTPAEPERYDVAVAAKADDLACALGGAHRLPVSFHEIAVRDTELGEHSGQGARHRKAGPPCSDVTRTRSARTAAARLVLGQL